MPISCTASFSGSGGTHSNSWNASPPLPRSANTACDLARDRNNLQVLIALKKSKQCRLALSRPLSLVGCRPCRWPSRESFSPALTQPQARPTFSIPSQRRPRYYPHHRRRQAPAPAVPTLQSTAARCVGGASSSEWLIDVQRSARCWAGLCWAAPCSVTAL